MVELWPNSMRAQYELTKRFSAEPRVLERLEVHAMSALGLRLHQAQIVDYH